MEFFIKHFEILADAPNGIKKLRELILQLAVMGLLVPQDPDEEPASVLLEKIKAEKERLIKEGKIKSQKPLPPIKDEEKPFELPNGWEWAYLDECSSITMGQSPKSKYYNVISDGLPFYQGKTDFGELYPVPQKWCSKPQKIAFNNDILISVRAPVGPTNVCKEKSCIGRGLASISTLNIYSHLYLLYTIRAFEKKISSMGVGSTFAAISYSHLIHILIPLPPLNEQKRIVSKVDRLMAFCDELEKKKEKRESKRINLNNACLDKLLRSRGLGEFQEHWQRIVDNFDILYNHPENVAKLKLAILQLAVMGKLVLQDPKDEPATVLYEKIKVEKEQLIKEGKIKSQKPLPPIKDEEKPFELPDSWKWVYLDDCSSITMGQSPESKYYNKIRDGLPFYQGKTDFGELFPKPQIWCSKPQKIAYEKDILISVRAPVGPTNVCKEKSCIGRGLSSISTLNINDHFYLLYAIRAFEKKISAMGVGSTFKAISYSHLRQILIPLPPHNEQKRIVSKVDRLISLCDRLAENLQEADSKRVKLFEAVVNQMQIFKNKD